MKLDKFDVSKSISKCVTVHIPTRNNLVIFEPKAIKITGKDVNHLTKKA